MSPLDQAVSELRNLTPGRILAGGLTLGEVRERVRFGPSPSSYQLQDDRGRMISPKLNSGGIGFRVTCSASDRLVVLLRRDDSNELAAPVAINISDLVVGKPIESQFSDGATWTLQRTAGDRLRISLTPPALPLTKLPSPTGTAASLFWDDQTATISVTTDAITSPTNEPLELALETRDHRDRTVSTQVWPIELLAGRGTVADASWQPPSGDGNYELRWELRRPSNQRSVMGVPVSLLRAEDPPLAKSRTPVVVLARQPIAAGTSGVDPSNEASELLGRIEPLGRSWSVSRLIPRWPTGRLASQTESSGTFTKKMVAGRAVAELAAGSRYTHTLPITNPRRRHRVIVHIPDGQPMRLGIVILDSPPDAGDPKVIRDATALRMRLKTNDTPWATVEVDFYPQSDSPQLLLINRDTNLPAAFEAIDVRVIDDKQFVAPEMATSSIQSLGGRLALMQFGLQQWLDRCGDLPPDQSTRPFEQTDYLHPALRLIAAIRAGGYGGVILTVNENGRSLYPTNLMTAEDKQSSALEMLLRLFERENLAFVPCISPTSPLTHLEQSISFAHAEGRKSSGISLSSPWAGQAAEQAITSDDARRLGIYNPVHPLVMRHAVELVRELAKQCENRSCVRSLAIMCDEPGCLRLPVAGAMSDSVTLDQFHASQPPGSPARSQTLAWIRGDGAAAFETWRSNQLAKSYEAIVAAIGDQSLWLMSTNSQLAEKVSVAEKVSEPDSAKHPQGRTGYRGQTPFPLTPVRLYRRSQLEPLAARCHDEVVSNATHAIGGSSSDATQTTAFYFAPTTLVAASDDALGLTQTVPLLDPLTAQMVVPRLIQRSDRTNLVIGGDLAIAPNDVRRRSLLRFQNLPAAMMTEVAATDGSAKTVKLRWLRQGSEVYLQAINFSRWPATIEVAMIGIDAASSVLADDPAATLADGVWQSSLQPGELVTLRARSATASGPVVAAWSARVAIDELQSTGITELVKSLVDGLAAITVPQFTPLVENGGFETVSATGIAATANVTTTNIIAGSPIVAGWLVAQHPANCVAIDDSIAHEGSRSIRLSNRDGRPGGTWIMSRPIRPPSTGRLAVSMRVRGEPSEQPDKKEPIELRMALECVCEGTAMRQVVSTNVRRDGRWSDAPLRIAIESLPTHDVDSLRLAIDVMSEGTVWIDSIQCEAEFMAESERSGLQSQMFLAARGIGDGDWTAAAKLLESHWVQQVLAAPADAPRPIIPALESNPNQLLDTAPAMPDKQATPPSRPGVADRLRSWLPRPLRF